MNWSKLRRLFQIIFVMVFLALFFWTENSLEPNPNMNVILRLDPFAAILSSLAGREFLLGSALSLALLVLSLLFGRVWCGWVCPLGTMLDWFSFKRLRLSSVSIPERWRTIKYWILLFSFGAALVGGLSILFLDPLTIWVRSLHLGILPALDWAFTGVERVVYPLPGFSSVVSMFDRMIRPTILPPVPLQVRFPWLFVGFFTGILVLNVTAERFWCRYVCPLGALLGLCSKAAMFRRRVGEGCRACVLCTDACPMGTIDPENEFASDPAECTVCMDCVDNCPRDETHFATHSTAASFADYDPSRRQVLLAFGAGVGATVLLKASSIRADVHSRAIHPPGAQHDAFLSNCVRCGLCMQVCPTAGLQPAVFEAGIEGFWTPVLVSRLGCCDFGCNACGRICPTGAIQGLTLEAKREQVIGKAVIDEDCCIAWAEDRDCIVCEEMCPLPEKAIVLEAFEIVEADDSWEVLRPEVIHDRCIGCGICEYKCPVEGEAAIQVVHLRAHVGKRSGNGRGQGAGRRGSDHIERWNN